MIALMATALAAGQADRPPQRPRMDREQRMERMFDMADTDRNGQISRAEFRAGMARMRGHRDGMRGGPGMHGPQEGMEGARRGAPPRR